MPAKVLMVQGTCSSAGKSLLVTALCRIFSRDGLRVAPFKAQNMALNSFVTPEGCEIGRAQAVQAEAAGILPHVDMNPVLLKPETDARSQVVVMGRPWQTLAAPDYYAQKHLLWKIVTQALRRLRSRFDLVLIEGAGSPAEINLRESDIVNMAVARQADAPVLLVGDIDRGGVFASLIGTLILLKEEERPFIKGLVINKFRGDPRLLSPGLEMLKERTGVPVLGVIPYLNGLHIAQEDSVALDTQEQSTDPQQGVDIAVIRLPRISNFDDFDPLALEPGVSLRFVNTVREIGTPAAVVLPGSKNTLSDFAWLRRQALDRRVVDLARRGAAVVGICGGYQMLGETISDPLGVEMRAEQKICGLGLLPVNTEFGCEKTTHQVEAEVISTAGFFAHIAGTRLAGYEIHAGQSLTISDKVQPLFRVLRRNEGSVESLDGATNNAGNIWGTYVHGLFNESSFRRAWLSSLGWTPPDRQWDLASLRHAEYDRLAEEVREGLDMSLLRQIIGFSRGEAHVVT